MEGDTAPSHQEQISLYGLFGDSSATLQGLDDHLSPPLLQQSPPCGSTLAGHATVTKSAIMSPPKQSITNGIQHGGMLLSDLADRSPSAGSITAASLCNFVSYGNQRCTNLVNIKGKRLCHQHSGEPVSMVQKAIFKKPASTNRKPADEFLPIGKPGLVSENLGQKIVRPGYNTTVLTAVSNMQTSPSLAMTAKVNGLDVSDNANVRHQTDSKQLNNQQVRLVKKVGKTITVSRRPVPSKDNEPSSSKDDPTVTNTGGYLQSPPVRTAKTPSKPNTIRQHPAPYSIPYYKKLDPVTVPSQVMEPRLTRVPSILTSSSTGMQTSTYAVTKSGGNDETVRKLLEVLNGKNMSMQEQLSILQSMGVTIVQAPVASSSYPFRNNHGLNLESSVALNMKTNVSAGDARSTNPVIRPNATLNHAVSVSRLGKVKASSGTKLVTNHGQATDGIAKPSTSTDKVKKNVPKSGQKRKWKQSEESVSKKSKFNVNPSAANLPTTSSKKTALNKTQSERAKQRKNMHGQRQQLALFAANPRPELVAVSDSSAAYQSLARYMNEKTLLEKDLFNDQELDIQTDVVKGDRGKALKQRLLKEHLSKKRKKIAGTSVNYEHCLDDLDSTDPFKALSAADNLLKSFIMGRQTRKTVHHQRVLDKLDMPMELCDDSYGCITDCDIAPVDETTDASIPFTLDTLLMKEQYNKLLKELDREELELQMLSNCFDEDAARAMNTVNTYLSQTKSDRPLETKHSQKVRLCQLSSDKGLRCNKKVLPYANYCKEHIWHCETQCLYKLNQNMKTVADIDPEPVVKRVRKRAKLLPLIKKYKKKKKKKVEGTDQTDEIKQDTKASGPSMVPIKCEGGGVINQLTLPKSSAVIERNVTVAKSEQAHQSTSIEETKRLDSSDDDLSLMTNEIMLSGVFDKLQDDAQDFDLFSEKNAEELERALLLAAASPSHEEQIDEKTSQGSSSTEIVTSRPNSLTDLDPGMMLTSRMNSSPDAIINCDAPKSAELPPSLEQFNESQIAHYTFGSSMGAVVKKECTDGSYPAEEAAVSLISAEDLQDLEGVLERLDAEEANSPKVLSSPAMDSYTALLARQLSQEVEGESLKRKAASASMVQSIGQPFKTPQSPSLSTSYSMSSSKMSLSSSSPRSRNKSPIQYCSTSINNPQPSSPTTQFKKPNALNLGNSVTVSSAIEVKNAASLPQEALPSPQKPKAMLKVNSSAMVTQYNRGAVVVTASSSQGKVKTSKSLHSSGNINLSGGSIQRTIHGKVQPAGSSMVQNQMVPLTLMQTQQSQGGNVIKVIMPPGTVINGSHGQQNMLLIPVTALVKSNMQSGGHAVNNSGHRNVSHGGTAVNVKPPVGNFAAGQQFFIVNNPSAGSSHTQLTLVQKPGNANSQQGIILKSQNTKDRKTFFGGQVSHNQTKQNASVKSPLNMQLKFGMNCSDQNDKMTTYAVSSAVSTVVSNVKSQTLPYGTVTKVVATEAGKMTTARNQGGRRKSKNTPRKPKARFDPITRKYVPVTDVPVSHPVALVPDSVMTSSLNNRNESLIKFNKSALSLQNKVQQIDSVLSSLNASARDQDTLLKGNLESKKTKSCVQAIKTAASSTNTEVAGTSNLKSTQCGVVTSIAGSVVQAKAGESETKISSTTRLLGEVKMSPSSVVLKHMQKTHPIVVSKSEISIKDLTTSIVQNTTAVTTISKMSEVDTARRTVHWNQTTTAGPEVSTAHLTVPVYITGAISAGAAFSGELTMARSVSGAAVPVLLPTRKAGANGQISQRVLLGNLASTGLTKVSAVPSGPATLLKQSLLSLPQSVVKMPKSKVSVATMRDVGKTLSAVSHNLPSITLRPVTTSRMEIGPKVSASITVPSKQNYINASVTPTTRLPILVASSKPHALSNDAALRKKSTPHGSLDMTKDLLKSDPVVLDPSSQ